MKYVYYVYICVCVCVLCTYIEQSTKTHHPHSVHGLFRNASLFSRKTNFSRENCRGGRCSAPTKYLGVWKRTCGDYKAVC